MLPSERRINALASGLQAKRYLEIGVLGGATFRAVQIPERTGVDPDFKFDISTVANERTRLIAKTSDEFFADEPRDSLFDIIFIDGMHTYEQVARDFFNAVVHSHSRTAIIIDDTVPIDVYSANPDQAEAMRHRRSAGSNDISWHGDVFKLVYFIHDFWPCLNYRTLFGSGNPQTLVWRAGDIRRPPTFNNMETISRLTYFDMHRHLDIIQGTSEEDAISLCLEQILGR